MEFKDFEQTFERDWVAKKLLPAQAKARSNKPKENVSQCTIQPLKNFKAQQQVWQVEVFWNRTEQHEDIEGNTGHQQHSWETEPQLFAEKT